MILSRWKQPPQTHRSSEEQERKMLLQPQKGRECSMTKKVRRLLPHTSSTKISFQSIQFNNLNWSIDFTNESTNERLINNSNIAGWLLLLLLHSRYHSTMTKTNRPPASQQIVHCTHVRTFINEWKRESRISVKSFLLSLTSIIFGVDQKLYVCAYDKLMRYKLLCMRAYLLACPPAYGFRAVSCFDTPNWCDSDKGDKFGSDGWMVAARGYLVLCVWRGEGWGGGGSDDCECEGSLGVGLVWRKLKVEREKR